MPLLKSVSYLLPTSNMNQLIYNMYIVHTIENSTEKSFNSIYREQCTVEVAFLYIFLWVCPIGMYKTMLKVTYCENFEKAIKKVKKNLLKMFQTVLSLK